MAIEREVTRRRFLVGVGGATAGALALACARDELTGDPYSLEEAERAALSRTPAAPAAATPQAGGAAPSEDQGHAARPETSQDRPQPGGPVAQVYDAALPPLDPAPEKNVVVEAIDKAVEVAGGVMLNAWTFDGLLPGKILRVRQGDSINFTFRNRGAIGHSFDFHAAQTPWNTNYRTIRSGDELNYTWRANFPGVFMYHCGTGPVIEHIANGMYGAIVVDPIEPLRPAREYVLVQSEFYLKADGDAWATDGARAIAVQPDFVVFNGAADQYQQQPLTAAVGELIRIHVVNAGPTLFSAFHIIGTVFDRVYLDGNPANASVGVSTYTIPPGGGATFELTIPEAGQYPFVTHSFAYTGLGAVGLVEVA